MKTQHITKTAFCIHIWIAGLFFFATFVSQSAFAAPANPNPTIYQQPDGTELTVQMKGDETIRWAVTPDGYTLLFTKDGYLEYADLDKRGDLKPSGVRASNENSRNAEEQRFLRKVPKGLFYSDVQVNALRETPYGAQYAAKKQRKGLTRENTYIGKIKIPLVLVGFQGKPITRTKEEFENLVNQKDYIGLPGDTVQGSVRDYFYDMSYERMEFEVEVFGPYMMPQAASAYSGEGQTHPLARALIDSIRADGANFADYDADNNGIIDGLHLIYAGYERTPIGSHAGTFALYDTVPVIVDDIQIPMFSISAEFSGDARDNEKELTFIGPIIHEILHVFGLPDTYDANGDPNGAAIAIYTWDVMAEGFASGPKGKFGSCPVKLSAWGRVFLGWTDLKVLEEPADITLLSPDEENVVYRINTAVEGEYYLIENRQQTSWDMYQAGAGMLIYQVDENFLGWYRRCVNCEATNRGYFTVQAACANKTSGCNIKFDQEPWPQRGKTSFTDETRPHAKSKMGFNTNKPITDIVQDTNNLSVSFKFRGGAPKGIYVKAGTIVMPDYFHENGEREVKMKIENLGFPVESAKVEWKVDDVDQTPYTWTASANDSLASGEERIFTLGKANLTEGKHTICATIVVENNTATNMTQSCKIVTVTPAFFSEDFEDELSGWTFVNGNQENKWIVDTALASLGTKSAYISNDGFSNIYNTATEKANVSHLYRDITFPMPDSANMFDIYFDFKGIGELTNLKTKDVSEYDYLEVRLVEANVTPVAGTALKVGTSTGKYYYKNEWVNVKASLPASYAGTTKRLVFTWCNDKGFFEGQGGDGVQSPAAIDNIGITLGKVQSSSIFSDIEIDNSSDLKIWTQDDVLYVKGLEAGQTWQIYNLLGNLVRQGTASSETTKIENVNLLNGVYVFLSNGKSAKFVR